MDVAEGLRRLTELLPLSDRKAALPPGLAATHDAVLSGFVGAGRPPILDAADAAALAAADLVVLDGADRVVGAYPFSLEPTPHRVRLPRSEVFAMCSLDALAIAPVFCTRTTIASTCAISGRPITIDQDGDLVVAIDPATPWVGIHWQRPCRPAAHTLCREMVFLFDEQTAREWQGGDVDGRFVCSVPAGIDLAERFFGPLT